MSLPRQVVLAEERANKLQEELLKQQQNPGESEQTTGKTDPSVTEQSVSDQSVAPTASGLSPEPKPDDSQSKDDYEHRFKVLQGKYNSEVPRLSSENKELKQSLKSLQDQLDDLKAAKSFEPLVKPEEIEEYGEGLVDLARRVAQEELSKKDAQIKKLEAKLDALEGVTTKTVEKDFFTSLSDKVSDWAKINDDKAFHKWLDETDELTGMRRQDLLSQAEQARDAERVAKFFKAFKKTSNRQATETNTALETQLAPNNTKTPSTPSAKKLWTRAEIKEFYDRMRRGQVPDKDAVAIEADIHAASIEGRVR